ncbi:SHOCT domain-containing protein [Haloarcula sp. CBA1130]|uniref:SHOCT domain-containing protein n=1 Tax=unclassified Haloarcula TaxID=2624677 RepID=UPI0012486746|nr:MULTISPECIES: SHOCT domain-containing protein [unclassified Haloarcula]KAA9396678.1 SHOCT domain-containing protein [Haloarcula sp. CBA1130]KAA9397696.1 SHOCT domain-containing protein [Haloarcula sp. CBA1129]
MQNPIQTRGIRSLGYIVIGALSLAVVGGMVLTHAAVPDAMMWGWHDGMWTGGHMSGWSGWGWGMILFGLLWMALLVALPAYLVYWLVTWAQSDGSAEENALAVLQARYARGEINDEEYEHRREAFERDT